MAVIRQHNSTHNATFARFIEENPHKPGVANARLVESGMASGRSPARSKPPTTTLSASHATMNFREHRLRRRLPITGTTRKSLMTGALRIALPL